MMMDRKAIDRLVSRYMEAQTTEAEEALLERVLSEMDSVPVEWQECQALFAAQRWIASTLPTDSLMPADWEHDAAAAHPGPAPFVGTTPRLGFILRRIGIAAAAVAVVVMVLTWWQDGGREPALEPLPLPVLSSIPLTASVSEPTEQSAQSVECPETNAPKCAQGTSGRKPSQASSPVVSPVPSDAPSVSTDRELQELAAAEQLLQYYFGQEEQAEMQDEQAGGHEDDGHKFFQTAKRTKIYKEKLI